MANPATTFIDIEQHTGQSGPQTASLSPIIDAFTLENTMVYNSQDSIENLVKRESTSSSASSDPQVVLENELPLEESAAELVDGPWFGWAVVFAGFMLQMISLGFCNVYGVYQHYYLTEMFKGSASTFQLAWVGTLSWVTNELFGPFTGAICGYFGHREAALAGVVITTLALILAAFSTQLWHLLLTQGVLYGLGASLIYFSSITLPAQWFTKRRGLVIGVVLSGGGFGGLWLSPIISGFLSARGLKWTMLVVAGGHWVIMIPISLLLKSRRETGHSRATRIKRYGYREGEADESDSPRKFVDFSILKNSRFCLLLVSGIFAISGYLTPFYFIGSYATQHGVDVTTAALMVGLMNGASAFGRIIMGQISDKIGYINSLFLATFTASLSLLVLWMYAKTLAAIAAFSVVYGLCGGAYFATTVSVAASICGIERLAEVTGIIYAAMAIGVSLGSPISGAILDTVKDHNDYTGVILWSGLTMLLGSTLQFGLKYMTDRRVFVRV